MERPTKLLLYGCALLLALLVHPGNGGIGSSKKSKTKDDDLVDSDTESTESSEDWDWETETSNEDTDSDYLPPTTRAASKRAKENSKKEDDDLIKSMGKVTLEDKAETADIAARAARQKLPDTESDDDDENTNGGAWLPPTTKAPSKPAKENSNKAHIPPVPEGYKVIYISSDGVKRPRLRSLDGKVPKELPVNVTEWQFWGRGFARTVIPTYEGALKAKTSKASKSPPQEIKAGRSFHDIRMHTISSMNKVHRAQNVKATRGKQDTSNKHLKKGGVALYSSQKKCDPKEENKEEENVNKWGNNKIPYFWRKTPVVSWKPVWWRIPDNRFNFLGPNRPPGSPKSRSRSPSRSPPTILSPSDEKLPFILTGRNLSEPQIFQVDDQTISNFFKDDGTGYDIPSNMDNGCMIDVCRLSRHKSPILLVGDQALQPIAWYNETDKTTTGKFFVENGQEVRRYCPGDYYKMSSYQCKERNLYKGGHIANDDELVCTEDYVPHNIYHESQCNDQDPDSVMLYSGYVIPSANDAEQPYYYPLLKICWQKKSAMPYWTKIRMHGSNTKGKCNLRSGDFAIPPNNFYASGITTLYYSSENKKAAYEQLLGTSSSSDWFAGVDRGHFSAYMDASYYPWQLLTNVYMNTAPQHSAANRRNHKYLEKEVRATVSTMRTRMIVVTGPLGYIRKRDVPMKSYLPTMTSTEIKAYNKIDDDKILELDFEWQQIPFNKFYWKILYHKKDHTGIVLLSSNIPIAHKVEKLCTDVCNEYGWLQTMNRFNFSAGFAYCCEVPDFLRKFPYISGSLESEKSGDLAKVKPLHFRGGKASH